MPIKKTPQGTIEMPVLSVWDSEYFSPREAFSVFREVICDAFMHWAPEFDSEQPFEGRIKGLMFDDKSIGHVSISPLTATRAKAHVEKSAIDGFYVNFVLSGELHVEQAGRSSLARQGDLIVYDTASPVKMTSRNNARYEDISILIPKHCFAHLEDAEEQLGNIVLTRQNLIEPLNSSLRFLAENMQSLSEQELISLCDSCIALLPLAAGCYGEQGTEVMHSPANDSLRQDLLSFVNRNIADPDLSPAYAARHFGLSVRYIHKLFAGSGTTFGYYVAARRLDSIRDDLLSPASRNQPISTLAFRWGFKDLSSFNRAFKKRYGRSPSSLRNRVA